MSFSALRERIAATPFVDTHEHLLEESTRLRGPGAHDFIPCADAALLLYHYAADDLHAAGMPAGERERFFAPDLAPEAKWRLLAPYWPHCRATGYLQAVRWTVRRLFGEDDLDAASFVRVSEQMQARARPGFYRRVLDAAGVTSCHVNSFEAIFRESEQPDLLRQDIGINALCLGPNLEALQRRTGIAAATLGDMYGIVDWYFERYGASAVAVKCSAAYARRLNVRAVPAELAAPLFAAHARGEALTAPDRAALENHLLRYCLQRATQCGLPVKLHCGYLAGNDHMSLARIRRHASDLCPLLRAFPETTFVLMHIGYPYQDEYIALAKHYRNVYIDLCWTWILNPAATVRFVREFLLGAPASKLFTFGGDYSSVEPIVGHAHLARHGLARALHGLVEDGWLTMREALELVEPLMRGNAERVFRLREPAAGGQQPAEGTHLQPAEGAA